MTDAERAFLLYKNKTKHLPCAMDFLAGFMAAKILYDELKIGDCVSCSNPYFDDEIVEGNIIKINNHTYQVRDHDSGNLSWWPRAYVVKV